MANLTTHAVLSPLEEFILDSRDLTVKQFADACDEYKRSVNFNPNTINHNALAEEIVKRYNEAIEKLENTEYKHLRDELFTRGLNYRLYSLLSQLTTSTVVPRKEIFAYVRQEDFSLLLVDIYKCYDLVYFNGLLYDADSYDIVGDHEDIVHCDERDDYVRCEENGLLYHSDDMTYLDYDEMYVNAHNNDLVHCHTNGCYIFAHNSREVIIGSGQETGMVHEDSCDLIRTDDETYLNEDVAHDNDCWYDDNCDEWREEHDRPSNLYYDNPFTKYYLARAEKNLSKPAFALLKNKLGIESITNRQFEGMPYTFGVEIETSDAGENFDPDEENLNFASVSDGSVSGPEFVSGVLTGDSGVKQVQKVCKLLNERNYTISQSCGVHVHIGGATFNRRFQLLSIMLGLQVQEEMFAMQPPSRQNNTYCKAIPDDYYAIGKLFSAGNLKTASYYNALKLLRKYTSNTSHGTFDKDANKKSRHPNGHYCSSRYKWMNLNNCAYGDGPNTIEFRLHSATMDAHKILMMTKLCMAFVNFVENRSRRITIGFNHAHNYAKRNTMFLGNSVSLREIIQYSYSGKNAEEVIEYVTKRTFKFN
jgi:hypothetical protein